MSEKLRNNVLTSTSALSGGGGCALIGAPTLISSTFSNSIATQPLTNILTTTAMTAAPTASCSSSIAGTSPNSMHLKATNATATTDMDPSINANISSGGNGHTMDADLPSAAIATQLNFHLLPAVVDETPPTLDVNSIMISSQISAASNDSAQPSQSPAATANAAAQKHWISQNAAGKSCRFPKLEECAHFHYERVQLGALSVRLLDDKSELLSSSIASHSIGGEVSGTGPSSVRSFSPNNSWFIIKVSPQRADHFLIKRSFENMQLFDEMLHRCVYDRKISGLRKLHEMEFRSEDDLEYAVDKYLERFSKIASDSLTCGTILTWLQLDNKGRRLPLADSDTMRSINTPAVGAAYGVRRYLAQASDEISIEVGDMISVIDMPSPAESIWWRGKKSHLQKSQYEVGFFPQSCVATIGDKVPRNFPMPPPIVGQLDVSPTKPVLRKHGKLIAFFRSFILSRPSRRRLKQSGIYRERVFSCDLSEHLLNSGQEIPMVLKVCADFIEQNGTVDGIYRLSGITSNIQRLRRAFDEERVPDLGNPEMKQDIHAVSSLLKMYFRELPNPLCTYQLYDNFVEAIQEKSESSERLRLMKETVLKLPPPHYRTLKYLAEHLNRISQHAEHTGMTDKNLAIVWAPNLLRSPALESGGVAALRGVGVQAVVTEYLIRNCYSIFDALEDTNARLSYIANAAAAAAEQRMDSLTDCESLLVEQREHDQALHYALERPKSLSASGPKLISLEEAQERHLRVDGFDLKSSMPISMMANNAANIGSYIEVGGGPSSLPDKYHTVLSMPRNLQKRKPASSWKTLFTRNQRASSNGNNATAIAGEHEIKSIPDNAANRNQHKFKQPAQVVSFAESNTKGKSGKALLKQEKPKSIELFDNLTATRGDLPVKAMEVCARSNSIDSLRTAGHSRSVSHDSYFDVLQSPQRGHMTNCPSRELSELGLNFDREEPEMRIFSESESLVSSPRVGKENVPPSAATASRRIMRARPEEFSSQTNSVNPSPKKQPRLNLLISPNGIAAAAWQQQQSLSATLPVEDNAHAEHSLQLSSDESCCKRYKLEDQLSDIQFIDCATPEHSIAAQSSMYTSVQVHAPPKSTLSRSSLYGSRDSGGKLLEASEKVQLKKSTELAGQMRYSYPSVQLGGKRKDQQDVGSATSALKERFSYPGSMLGSGNSIRYKETSKMQVEEQQPRNISRTSGALLPELLRARSRSSLVMSGSNSDISKPIAAELERTKLCITPCSPIQSPRYSLLVADATSSENSSALNTPQYDLDPLMLNSAMSGLSTASSNLQQQQQQQQQLLLTADNNSHETLSNSSNLNREQQLALKREMSLDLQPMMHGTKQLQQHLPSPNNSNFTDNTSQSVTPSEFGYQHLQRQSSMHSLIETDENSAVYEEYEHTPSNLISPAGAQKAGSPIKSTISITYNLKSPTKDELPKHAGKPKRGVLLETSFDEQTVYEQVKLFKNSVTEVNQLLVEQQQQQNDELPATNIATQSDSLAAAANAEKEKLLYQNVQLRKPKSVYENLLGEQMKTATTAAADRSVELDSLESNPLHATETATATATVERKSPSNFSVKQLANKFESSPVEAAVPAFDFSVRNSIRKYNSAAQATLQPQLPEHKSGATVGSNSSNKQLHKSTDITRSLDENAFVREFGTNKYLPDFATTRSTQQLPELSENCSSRRKSFDFTRPKTLNPPKRLPGMAIAEELCLKSDKQQQPPVPLLKLNKDNCNFNRDCLNTNAASCFENDFESTELKITPTTENRISLIQNNVLAADMNNSNTQQPQQHSKVLSGVKLDRERIDRIKEERRQQLTQKYQTDSLKSRSKTDLHETKFNADSLRVKSKSRTDMRSVANKDNDNLKDFVRTGAVSLHAGSESALHASNATAANVPVGYTQRVRSISDEKNQNSEVVGMASSDTMTKREEFSARIKVQQFERKSMELANGSGQNAIGIGHLRDAKAASMGATVTRNGVNTNREKISPQFSIRDVTAMFESRAQNQQ